jgi:hypothetical protein
VLPTPIVVEPQPTLAKPSILVLPFRNISGDPGQDYLADAVTSDLTVDLSQMRDMIVISAETALTYKRSSLDIRQIGHDLGVRYLVVANIGRVAIWSAPMSNCSTPAPASSCGATASRTRLSSSSALRMRSLAGSLPPSTSSWCGRRDAGQPRWRSRTR